MIGCDCAVCRSDDPADRRLRAAALLRARRTTVLVDCGPDVRAQLLRARAERIDAVVITHEHNDHIIGLDDLRPFMFRQREPMRIYAEQRVRESIRERFAYAFAASPYPGAPRFELLDAAPGQPITVGDAPPITPLRVWHGKLPILGFRVGDLAYCTDVKTVAEDQLGALGGLATLVTSALHHHRHHSHMNLAEAIAHAGRLSPKRTLLTHCSHLMGRHAEVNAVLPEGIRLAHDTAVLPIG